MLFYRISPVCLALHAGAPRASLASLARALRSPAILDRLGRALASQNLPKIAPRFLKSRFGNVLGASWHYLGPSWRLLGPSWRYLGPSWRHVGPSWRHLGTSWTRLGIPKTSQDSSKMTLGCPNMAPERTQVALKSSQDGIKVKVSRSKVQGPKGGRRDPEGFAVTMPFMVANGARASSFPDRNTHSLAGTQQKKLSTEVA